MAQGFTLERLGCNFWNIVPSNITLSNYVSNFMGVHNTITWNFGSLYKLGYFASSAGSGSRSGSAMNFMVTLAYAPRFLTYDGTTTGVPQNWNVYMDIVSKVCIYLKAYSSVKYIEIWNEPDGGFLTISGSPYATKAAAYMDIYFYTVQAIKASGMSVLIGGTAGADPVNSLALANAMLSNPKISADVGFLTYHHYDGDSGTDMVDAYLWEALALNHNRTALPVFVDEWNYSYLQPNNPLNSASTDAIAYVARRLSAFLTSGVAGSNMYHLQPPANDSSPGLTGLFHNGTFTPKTQSYRLMSVILGLGGGLSTIVQSSFTNGSLTFSLAAINHASQPVLCLTNEGNSTSNLSLALTGLAPSTAYTVAVWEASALNPTQAMRQSFLFNTDASGSSNASYVSVGQKSVVGLVFTGLAPPGTPPPQPPSSTGTPSPSPPPLPPPLRSSPPKSGASPLLSGLTAAPLLLAALGALLVSGMLL
ncbi:MAG: hypothetical protein WDW36_009037 [Sanguina aurantia]